jgi:glutathione synthase
VRLLFIIDPLERLALAGDTSYALMLEAAARGWDVWTCQVEHLGLVGDDAIVDASPTIVMPATTPADAFQVEAMRTQRLADFDVVLMRKDPPVDVNYLHATWILDHARGKTLLVNDPRGLRELNEHLAVLRFPQLTPPTIVTRSADKLRAFKAEQGGAIVVKPVDGYGGLGIFVVRDGDPNASSILETSTGAGTRWTLAQKYLPEAAQGDKRIILVDGEPVGAVLRVPAEAEARGNLHVEARLGRSTHATARSRAIARSCASSQIRRLGRDRRPADGDQHHLPTGVRHASRLDERNVAAPIMERLSAWRELARQVVTAPRAAFAST